MEPRQRETQPPDPRYLAPAVCGLLLLAVGLVFGQTVRHGFVEYDDDEYVYENPQVVRGLTAEGIGWAFTHIHGGNWHPLTGISHMLDCQIYGPKPWGHHLTNVLLHGVTAVLLFLVLRRMTGWFWPSAFVAAVFAVHPLRVESVAWVSERKDVLSGLFFMLTLWAYVGYVRRPFSLGRYLTVPALFALGLMAKPMLVTLPFVLLLLDYWPLGRMASPAAGGAPAPGVRQSGRFAFPMRLVLEKAPLLALAAASCVVTLWAQQESMMPSERLTLPWRLGNAAVSYVAYMVQMFYPAGLAVLYPHPGAGLPAWKTVGALLVLAGITVAALAWRRRRPYLLVGWLWYLVTLLPVIGLVQVGIQAMADRYTYLTQIGLYIALAFGVAHACRSWPYRHWACGVASVFIVAVLMGCAWHQTSFWYDTETLWTHTLACTSRNAVAHNNLGAAFAGMGRASEAMTHLQDALELKPNYAEAHSNLGYALAGLGRTDEAMAHYQKALELKPNYAEAHSNLGNALVGMGRLHEAMAHLQKALELKPGLVEAQNNLGNALAGMGRIDEAMARYRKVLELKPDFAETHSNLGVVLASLGRIDEAMAHYQKALELKPNHVEAHSNLGIALARLGRIDEAMTHFQKAMELNPDFVKAYNNLGVALADMGRVNEAMAYYQKALELNPDYAEAHGNLGNALVGLGRIDEAMTHFQSALDLATRQNKQALADSLRARIASHKSGTQSLERPLPPANTSPSP